MRMMIFVVGSAVALAVVTVLLMIRLYHRKLAPGQALVITSTGGQQQRVTFSGAFVLPIVQRADQIDITIKTIDVALDGERALISKDGVRTGIKASFHVRVNMTQEDVLKVAQTVGCQQASDPEAVRALFRPKCVEALRSVARQLDFEDLQRQLETFRDQVIRVIGLDLNGFVLEDVAVERVARASNKPADEVGPFR